MLKRILMCLAVCLLACQIKAQSFSVDALLSGKQKSDSNVKVFFQDELEPPQKEFIPTPVKWEPEAPSVAFTTPFGQTYKANYVTHIPFIGFQIAVSPSGRIFVTEDIYYMAAEPAPTEAFQRSFFRQLTTLTQHQILPKITLVGVYRDGAAVPVRLAEDDRGVSLTLSDGPETRGLHHYVITYTLQNSVLWGKQGNALFISLLGSRQPYAVERIAGLVSLPAETSILETRFSFGDNNLETDKAVAFLQDQNQTMFRSNRWLPAEVDVRLSLSMSKEGLVPPDKQGSASNAFFNSLWLFILFICVVLMCGYYVLQIHLSGNTVESKAYLAQVRQRWLYKPAVMRWVLARSVDRRTLACLMFALASKGVIRFHQKGSTYELTRQDTQRNLSLSERLVLRKLFKGKTKVVLKDLSLPKFIKHQLIPSVHLACGGQYFLLTKQYILMGAVLVVLGAVLAAFSGCSLGALFCVIACLLVAWAACLHLFFTKSAYRIFLRILYEQYQSYMAGFSEDTPKEILLKNVPFAVALDLTSLFPLKAGQLPWLTTSEKSDSLSAVEKDVMQNLLYSKKTEQTDANK